MELKLKLNKKQSRAWKYLDDKKTTEILYGGAAGGGKSFLGVAWIITQCIKYPGTKWIIGRSELKSLKNTTLATFFDVCSMWKFQSDSHYKFNIHDSKLKWFNGSEILFIDLKLYPSDPNFDSLGSLEITGGFIDEANQITEKAKTIIASRIRYKLDENHLIPKLLMSCNPSKGWVYDCFYKAAKNQTLEKYRAFIPALVTDNPEISRHYIEQLKKSDLITKKRLLYGEWEYEDELSLFKYESILKMFDLEDYLEPAKSTYYLSCDIARLGKDKTVIVLWKDLTIVKIFTLVKATTDLTVLKIKELEKLYAINRNHIIIDTDGIGGGVADHLKGCQSFVNGSTALNGENFKNLKNQCLFKLAEYVNNDKIKITQIRVEEKESLIQELEVIRMKDVDKDTKRSTIGKDEVRRLIGRSPDFSDAIMFRMLIELQPKNKGNYFFQKLHF